MSTLSKIDPSTLGWVRTEIDETLKQARLALESYTENTADDSKLRHCTTYLHQVLGTLQMVELDGAALLASETEVLAESILNGRVAPEPAAIETLIRGILTLPEYLARLQFGQPDAPLRFLSLLNDLRACHGAPPLNELDLFQPDLDVRPPKREGRAAPAEADYAQSVRSLRPAFQASLLNWLRNTGNRQALDELASLMTRLQDTAPLAVLEQMFWVAGGYAEALNAGVLEPVNERKKLLARLEQQLKKVADGADRNLVRNSAEALTKAMLYEIGQAPGVGGRTAEIRRAFELNELLPGSGADYDIPTPEALQSMSAALGKEIEQAQDLMSTYFEQGEAATLEPLAALLRKMAGTLEMLNVDLLKTLVDELAGMCEALVRGDLQRVDSVSMPMAGALLLLENSARDIQTLGISWKRRVEENIAKLQHLRAHGGSDALSGIEITDASLTDTEFKQLATAVGGEIRINLGKIEEILETFAADPEQHALLESVPQYLSQIQGALQILGQERAAELVVDTHGYVVDLHAGHMGADSAILDALAVAVGSVGAYVEGLERDRPNLDSLLANARSDLAAAVTGKRPHSGSPETLLRDVEQNLRAWLMDHNDHQARSALQQDLRDLAWLAGAQRQERIGKICLQMISLLDMVESGEVSSEVDVTMRQSYDALVSLAGGTLKSQALAKAAPRPTSKAKAEAAAPVEPGFTVASIVDDDDIILIFIEDAREMIALINKTLPNWQVDPNNRDVLLDLRRAFHTLKGSGRMVGASDISEFAWAIENMLNKVREGKISHSPAMFDLLVRTRDVLPDMVAQLEGAPPPETNIEFLRATAEALADNRPVPEVEATPVAAPRPVASPVHAPAAAPTAVPSAAPPTGEELPTLDPALLQIFSNETRGHVDSMRAEVEKCRASGLGGQVTESMVRAAHTLQGSARAVGLKPMAEASGEAERLLHSFQSHQHPLDEDVLTLFMRLASAVEKLIGVLSQGGARSAGVVEEFSQIAQAARAAHAHLAGEPVPTRSRTAPPPAPAAAPPVAPLPAGPVADDVVHEKLDSELLEIFLEEAVDIMASIEESLTAWRGNRGNTTPVAELKRQLHTLKGGARMAGALTMGNLGHHTESLLGEIESGRVVADNDIMDLMDDVHDALVDMIDRMQNRQPVLAYSAVSAKVMTHLGIAPAPSAPPVARVARTSGTPSAPPPAPVAADPAPVIKSPPRPAAPVVESLPDEPVLDRRADGDEIVEGVAAAERRGQIRVRTSLLNELVNFAGEVSISRSRMEQQIFGLRENLSELNRNVTRFRDQIRELEIQSESQILARAQEEASRVGEDFDPLEFDRFSRLQTLSRSLAESLHDLFTIRGNLENYASQAEGVLQQQARINTDLQEGLMRTRMTGFATQGARLRHIVRQTGREVGKRVELELVGGEVDVDRTVLDRMIGPFEHMIRNAVDHGIEPEAERIRAGKPAHGRITITASHEGSEIVIRFMDDGAGLDIAAIRRKAAERGLIKSGANLSDEELIQFILMAGFSTAGTVTQLSGRGVGMDVVHTEVKQLGGSITVDTRRGTGTTFIIRLPLTLSISQALMVRVGDELYAVPLSAVVNILEVPVESLKSIQIGSKPLLNYLDQLYPFMHLGVRLGVPSLPHNGKKLPVLLARSGGRQVAIQVDGLAGTREIVIKPLGMQLAGIEGLGGATILGDGRVVLILDIPGLWLTEEGMHVVHEAETAAGKPAAPSVVPEAAAPVRDRALVMVVDDSITVRKVTQRHLQKRGIDVLLAKDGVDAMELLREHVPDVMLVDIEMPRMDGYELTSHVRSDARLKHIPIVMITSRAGEKHRDKAFAMGVNSYMTKPYQEDALFDNINSLLPAHLSSF